MFTKLKNIQKRLPAQRIKKVFFFRRRAVVVGFFLVAALLTLPRIPSKDNYKKIFQTYLSQALHKTVRVKSISVAIFPNIRVECNKITVEEEQKMRFSSEALKISIRVLPLLIGKLEIDELKMESPRLDYKLKAASKTLTYKTHKKRATKRKSKTNKKPKRPLVFFYKASIPHRIKINNGEVHISGAGKSFVATSLSLSVEPYKDEFSAIFSGIIPSQNKVKKGSIKGAFNFTPPDNNIRFPKELVAELDYKGKVELKNIDLEQIEQWKKLPLKISGGTGNMVCEISGKGKRFYSESGIKLQDAVIFLDREENTERKLLISSVSGQVTTESTPRSLSFFCPELQLVLKDFTLKSRIGYRREKKRKNGKLLLISSKTKSVPLSFFKVFTKKEKAAKKNIAAKEKDQLCIGPWYISGELKDIRFLVEGNPDKMTKQTLLAKNSWFQGKMKLRNGKISPSSKNLPKMAIESDVFFNLGCLLVKNLSINSKGSYIRDIKGVFSPKKEGGFYHLEGSGKVDIESALNTAYLLKEKNFLKNFTSQNKKLLSGAGDATFHFGISHGLRSGIKLAYLGDFTRAKLKYRKFKKESGVKTKISAHVELPPEGGVFIPNAKLTLGGSKFDFFGQKLLKSFYLIKGKRVKVRDVVSILPKSWSGSGSFDLNSWVIFTPQNNSNEKNISANGTVHLDNVSVANNTKKLNLDKLTGEIELTKNKELGVNLAIRQGQYQEFEFRNLTANARIKELEFLPSNGGLRPDISKVSGRVSLNCGKGKLKKFGLLSRILDTLNTVSIFKKSIGEWSSNKLLYKSVSGNFDIRQGSIHTEDLYLTSNSLNIITKGNINIKDKTIDSKFYIQPLGLLDSIIKSIPILSKAIEKKGSVIEVGVNVKGSISKPKITSFNKLKGLTEFLVN